MDYKKLIIALLRRIDNEKFIRRIYVSLHDYARESKGAEDEEKIV